MAKDSVIRISVPGYLSALYLYTRLTNGSCRLALTPVHTLAPVRIAAGRRSGDLLSVSMAQVRRLPTLAGEPDVFKALATMPGVSGTLDGLSGLSVRGGSPDQNLTLADEAVIYLPMHLMGFMSSLNSEAYNSVDLYKGAFPARLGGRLSAFVQAIPRTGDSTESATAVRLGLLSSGLHTEGAIGKRLGYLLAGRASYLSLVMAPLYAAYRQGKTDSYANFLMYDANLHMTWAPSTASLLAFSLYNSQDHGVSHNRSSNTQTDSYRLGWRNTAASLRHQWQPGRALMIKSAVTYSAFRTANAFEFCPDDLLLGCTQNEIAHQIKGASLGNTLLFTGVKGHSISAGWKILHEQLSYGLNSASETLGLLSFTAFAEDRWRLSKSSSMTLGMRFSVFQPASEKALPPALEPRALFEWTAPQGRLRCSAAYARSTQPLHQLSASNLSLPLDIWVPASAALPFSAGDQVSGSVSYSFPDAGLSVEVGAYLKLLRRLALYTISEPSLEAINYRPDWATQMATGGRGNSQGIECMLKKMEGKVSGWISYTWQRNRHLFSDINSGVAFPSAFDRPHQFSAVLQMPLGKWLLSTTLNRSSGIPVTAPVGIWQSPNGPILLYGPRNNARMPAYFRADMGLERDVLRKKSIHTWRFGLYNATNQLNPFFVGWRMGEISTPAPGEALFSYTLTAFPMLPYFSWGIRFQQKHNIPEFP